MRTSRDSDISTIDTVLSGLTDQRPLLCFFSCYTEPGPILRDMHWELELGVVCRGRMKREAKAWSSELSAGMVWICGSWEPHGYAVAEAPCEVAVFVISPLFLTRLSIDLGSGTALYAPFAAPPELRPQLGSPEGRHKVLAIVRELFANRAYLGNILDSLAVAVALQRILLVLCQGWQGTCGNTMAADPFSSILPALRLALSSPRFVPVSEAAKACGMSRNTFSSRFRRLTGLSFADFSLRRRLRGAAIALTHTSSPVKTIAFDWGFTDPSHLVKAFSRVYGCTPGEYRKNAGQASGNGVVLSGGDVQQ